jgi:hypothetical protein
LEAASLFAGLLGASDEIERTPTQEGFLLVGRLLMAVAFCFVGLIETRRVTWGQLHGPPPSSSPSLALTLRQTPDPPDGHDVLWPKLVQLLLVVPFTLGYKTTAVTELLAVSLVLEAVTVWTFWREVETPPPPLA